MEYLKLSVVAAILIYLNIGCGQPMKSQPGPKGDSGQPCSVYKAAKYTIISCPDGSRITLTDGVPGTNGTNGQDGAVGETGPVGDTGSQGAPGIAGNDGVNGQDGTQIVPVKFCSQVANYPTTFPEYGLCINNQLYAVYSALDGFLTLIPPGLYNSNAIGSACTFEVKANCAVELK